jgi:signal transduction histidine kinase
MNEDTSYAPLFFFYNTKGKEILFSSLPLESFFGSSIDLKKEPFFLHAFKDNDTENITKEWQSCLQLKEKETINFSFNTVTANNNSLLFDFSVLSIGPSSFSDSPGLLVHIEKTLTSQPLYLQNKSASNYQKDYAEFIELAAHDLDAPLRKLSVLIERLVNKINPGSDDIAGYITRIQTCLSDMRSMIDSLSLLSGFSGLGQKTDTCHIDAIVRETIEELLPQTQDRKIVKITSSLPELQGNRTQYKELFRSLIRNAILFSKSETIAAIEIHSTLLLPEERTYFDLSDGSSYYKIVIADNGIGFRQEYSEKIFQPFVRLHGKSEYPGHGMGLAICKKIVENHQGIIYAEGNASEGARFILILPQTII